VLSNDSDLAGPLEQARARVPAGTVNPTNRPLASDLRGYATSGVGRHWWRTLKATDFLANQLPGDLSTARENWFWHGFRDLARWG
jgi:hypothetical protein